MRYQQKGKYNCGQFSDKSFSLGKGRSRAKKLIVPKRSPHLSSTLIAHRKYPGTKGVGHEPIDGLHETASPVSEGKRRSQRISTVPQTSVPESVCGYLPNCSSQTSELPIKSKHHDKVDTTSTVTLYSPLFTNNGMVTRSRARSNDIQTISVSPIKCRPSKFKSLGRENKYGTSRTVQLQKDSQIRISPMYSSDLLSPTNSGKLDISIECHTRKSLCDLDLYSAGGSTDGSQREQEPEVITSNNVVVALMIAEDEQQVSGVSLLDKGTSPVHHPAPKVDRVACITIETGSQSEEANRAAVEINIRPDLFNGLHGFGSSLKSDQ